MIQDLNQLSGAIIDAAIEVHRELGGPGLLESVYEEALVEELTSRGFQVERQQLVPILYKGKLLATPLRLDLRVNQSVIVDPKAVTDYNRIYDAQMLTYLRLTNLKLGLVINFGERLLKDGIHRIVTAFDFCSPRLCVSAPLR